MATHTQTVTSSGSSSTASAVLSPAPVQGSLLVAACGTRNSDPFDVGSGWTAGPLGNQLGTAYKVAGAGESTTQSPFTGVGSDWECTITEYAVGGTVTLDASGATNDASSPQDRAALNPTDDIEAILYAAAMGEASVTYSGQTIGGVAATERADNSALGVSLTVFDRLNVNTGSSTFAAQATASGTPSNGAIALLVFKLPAARAVAGSQPTATGVLARIAKKLRALAGVQPTATGLLTRQLDALRATDGAQEAPSGVLEAVLAGFTAILEGAQEAATGTLEAVWTSVRQAAGSQEAPSGVLDRTLYVGGRALAGVQLAATGVLTFIAPTPNVAGVATLTETLRDTATLTEAIRDTATLTVSPVGG